MEDFELRERLDRIEANISELRESAERSTKETNQEIAQKLYEENQIKEGKADRIEELLAFIEEKRNEAKDPFFTQYLNVMEGNLLRQQTQIEDIAQNLDHNYKQYQINMKNTNVGKTTKNAETAEHINPVFVTKEPMEHVETAAPMNSDLNHVNVPVKEGIQADIPPVQEIQTDIPMSGPVPVPVPASGPAPVPSFEPTPMSASKPAPGAVSTFDTNPVRPKTPTKKTDMEFKVGAIALSVIGALFIISAFVIFGMNYMNNLSQGLLLYILAGAVIAFSEFILRKNIERFAQAVTGLGICILYTATILNYLYLQTISAPVAIVLTLAVSGFSLFLSKKRDSSLLRLIGILGCYISFVPLDNFDNDMAFIIPCAMVLIANIMYILLPVAKERFYVPVIHAIANVAFTVYVVVIANISEISMIPSFIFIIAMIVTIYAIFWRNEFEGLPGVFYVLCLAVLTVIATYTAYQNEYLYGFTALFAIVLAACYFFYRNKDGSFVGLYCFTGFVLIAYYGEKTGIYLVAVACILAIYKILTFKENLKYADIVVSSICAGIFLVHANSDTHMQYAIMAVFVLSVISMKYFKTFHEILLFAVLNFFAVFVFDDYIAIPLSLAFTLLCLVLFALVDRFRDENYKVFIYVALASNLIAISWASMIENPISLSIILVLQIAIIFLGISDKLEISKETINKVRLIILVLFLTYMIFIFKIAIPIVTSILLMVLAIASVGAGFIWKQKCIRIYGLILSLFVCGKILVIDFKDTASQDRIILFFVVGIIALAISYLYMRIERSISMKEKL